MHIVKIVPPESDAGKLLTGYQTRVLTQDGAEIHGIASITLRIVPDDVYRAEMEIYCGFDAIDGAVGTLHIADPLTGTMKEVSRIEFADGTSFDA